MGSKRRGLWVAMSTKMPMSRLALEGSADAFKLWVVALCVAREEQTAGDVSPRAVGRLAGVEPGAAEELLQLGYWHRDGHECTACPQPGDGRVQIHSYLKWQDSPEEIEQRTEAGRVAARARWASDPESGSHTTRIQNENENEKSSLRDDGASAPPSPRSKSKRATPPPPWLQRKEPIPESIQRLIDEEGYGLPWVVSELTQIHDYALAHGKTYKDWEAMVRNWLRRSAGERRGGQVGQEFEQEVREWLRVNPCPVPEELEALEAEDGAAFQEAMRPVRAEHQKRAEDEVRRRSMRSVR